MAVSRIHEAEVRPTPLAGVVVSRLISDDGFPRHSHDEFGIGRIDTGGHRSWSDAGLVDATAGDLITVNPGEMHDGRSIGAAPRRWRMLHLAPERLAALAGEGAAELRITRPVIGDGVLAARFDRAHALGQDRDADPMALEEALIAVLSLIGRRHMSRDPFERGPATPWIERARRRIDEAPAEPVTLAMLAAEAGVSRFQLLRGFAREVGATPHAYLLQRRVALARRLVTLGRPLADIAYEAGFADQAHLTRAFRRQYGLTPGRFRAALG